MRSLYTGLLLITTFAMTGCRSKYIEATLVNKTTEPLSLIQLEYPTASFGTQQLAAGGTFHYRFKLIGSGPLKVNWTDAAHRDHNTVGPQLLEGEQGQLILTFTASDKVEFAETLRP